MPILDKFNLTGRVALVTGGNRGLGQQMALALAQAGADVALTSRDQQRADEAAAEIAQSTGRNVRGYACDVSSSTETTNVVQQVIAELGGLHIVVNNAGINIRGPIDELTPEDFRKVLDTNVVGVWNVCRAAAGHLKAQEYGRVINIGSTLSIAPPTPAAKARCCRCPAPWPWNGRPMGLPSTQCCLALLPRR
jgi:NAD(P)-dependent dehydrogenase (short-subunit alcohol dehydrogenase family)